MESVDNTSMPEDTSPSDEFVPEKVGLFRRGVRRGKGDGQLTGHNNMISSAERMKNSDIHSSVIFAENADGNMLDEDDTQLFNEVDELCPHNHEGGEIAKEPSSTMSLSSSVVNTSQLKASYLSFASSLRQSTKRSGSSIITNSSSQVLNNDLQNLLDNNDGGTSQHKRSSIVGGKPISDMTFDEKREIFAPERSRDSLIISDDESNKDASAQRLDQSITSYAPIITGGGETTSGMVSSVDWSSLTKSCKRAKETMRDAVSSQVVVKNMFLTHLTALTTVLTLYARRYTEKRGINNHATMEEVLTRTIETRRALRFAISCLAPSPTKSDLFDESAKQARQELQAAAAEGKCLPSVGQDDENEIRHQGLHVSLAELIVSGPMSCEHMIGIPNGAKYETMILSLEKNQLSVRTLAARLLCNIVTDNPAAAATVLLDIPFSPSQEQLESRMSGEVLASNDDDSLDDSAICWSDLIHAVSQTQTIKEHANGVVVEDGDCADREILAAVVAALHNLLASMEMRDSLLEITSEMKRIEKLKQHTRKISEEEVENESEKPIDALFDAASSPALVNALLRSTLPASTIIKMLQPAPTSTTRPKCVPPKVDNAPVEDPSDSATEWISFVLERLVSRGLVLQVLHSAGGKGVSTTPEQVVLISCIRQAVDDYQLSLPPPTDSGEFDMRRLSVTVKSSNEKSPHPLWGRGDGLRTAVPVLHSLANEAEKMRLRALTLQTSCGGVLPTEEYEGELNCTNHILHDIRDILAQCLGKSTSQAYNDQCILAEARSVLGRDTSLIANCCEDLARIVDVSLTKNSGKSARELKLSSHEQETAISTVRLIGNLVYQCQHNQDLLRSTVVLPMVDLDAGNSTKDANVLVRTGLHVLLSATSLGIACFTLREWCIVAIRNAVENNEANIEMVRRLEANEALGDTPELQKLGVRVDLDDKGNVRVQKRESNN
eukprot:scaffold3031_cov116-Skeletonema_dohrnii-CCMP3373.AAC.5